LCIPLLPDEHLPKIYYSVEHIKYINPRNLHFWCSVSGHEVWILRNERLRMFLFNKPIGLAPIDKFAIYTDAHLRNSMRLNSNLTVGRDILEGQIANKFLTDGRRAACLASARRPLNSLYFIKCSFAFNLKREGENASVLTVMSNPNTVCNFHPCIPLTNMHFCPQKRDEEMQCNTSAACLAVLTACLFQVQAYTIIHHSSRLAIASAKGALRLPRRLPVLVAMSGSDSSESQEQKRQEAARLMNEAKLAAEAAEEAAKRAAELKAAFPTKPVVSVQTVSPEDSETFGLRSLQRDRTLESRFDLAPPNPAGGPERDEDAAFGLSGSAMRTVKSLTWVGIGLLLAIEAWALTQPTSPLINPPTPAELQARSAPRLGADATAPATDVVGKDGGRDSSQSLLGPP
jgi:hypothetical protein